MRLPANWDAPTRTASPEEQFADAIAALSPKAPVRVVLDGAIHRFPVKGDKGRGKAGWYVGYADNIPAGMFGDWRSGEAHSWHADMGREISPEERAALNARYAAIEQARRAERQKYIDQIAASCAEIFAGLEPASADNPYLQRKRVGVHGIYQTGDGRLAVPVVLEGRIISAQYISANGEKQFHGGGMVAGGCFIMGQFPPAGPLYIAEGYATAASVHEATGSTVAVAYSAHNLKPVAEGMRSRLGPAQEIVIVGDNDGSGTGQKAASEAASAVGAKVVIPPEVGTDANDYVNAGGDLKELLTGGKRWLTAADDFCAKPAPIRWLVKRWLQAEGLSMIFGDSGVGKTFVALDWVLRIAAGMSDWCGFRVKPGKVAYLAGEGHYGLRARIAGWKLAHGAGHLDMWISSGASDLNTAEGLASTIAELKATGQEHIDVIVIDTLHRFLSGDENKALDAKTMLDACSLLSQTFGAAVVLVHHTGVAADAKGRARGSSAWRGALDNQFCVSAEKDLIRIEQVKQKDAELSDPVYLRRVPVALPGWYDEDGEPVSTCILEQAEGGSYSEPEEVGIDEPILTKAQHMCLQAYREAAEKYGHLDEAGKFAGVEEGDWRNMFIKNFEGRSAQSAFSKRKKDLCERGIIVYDEAAEVYMMGSGYELEMTYFARRLTKNSVED